jgi:signal peptidase II
MEEARVIEDGSAAASVQTGIQPTVSMRRVVFALCLAAIGLGWDLWTKHQVFALLGCPGVLPGPGVHPVWKGQVLGIAVQFQLETTLNFGALWGMGQGQTWLFAALSVVAIGVIGYFLRSGQATASWWLTIIAGLLLAGTMGNLFDRLGLHGLKNAEGDSIRAVRDFLDFWFFGTFHWATFNFADTYLVTGAIMLVAHSFFIPPEEARGSMKEIASSPDATV